MAAIASEDDVTSDISVSPFLSPKGGQGVLAGDDGMS